MIELEKTEREISAYEAELQKLRLEKSQREHQFKAKQQQIKNLYRKTRTHRLIERVLCLKSSCLMLKNLQMMRLWKYSKRLLEKKHNPVPCTKGTLIYHKTSLVVCAVSAETGLIRNTAE